jgi:hypothetical protein
MSFGTVTEPEMRAAQILTGLTMVGFLAAPIFGQRARQVRIGLTSLYILAIVVFTIYALR